MSDADPIAAFEAPDPAHLAPLFPGYAIEYLIAMGGMGAVYKAVQLSLDRPVAIKILPREFGEDASFRANFEAEAMAMARLNHPNLIGVYDFGEVAGMLFIVMEFVAGKTLFHSAHGIAIAADAAVPLVIEVCLGLAHAHEHGILHRDIKPGNILLDQQARPKIGDFGLARPMDTAVADGETIFGTPHYTAPEVIKYPNSVGARADIFSVGVVLHELLTGRLPADDPRPPSAICGCDHRLDAIIRRATHPSPDLRYTSAAEMARDLGAITTAAATPLAKLRTTAPSGKRGAPVRRMLAAPSKSSSGVVILAVIGVAAALLAGVLVILKRQEPPLTGTHPVVAAPPAPLPPQPAPPTVDQAPKPTPKPAPEPVAAAPAPAPAPKPEPQPEVAKTEPVPPPPVAVTPVPATAPTFDVPGFFDRVRDLMRQKATPIFAAHATGIEKNYEAFERQITYKLRLIDRDKRPPIEKRVDKAFETWRTAGKRVPETLKVLDIKPEKPGTRHPPLRNKADQEKDFVNKVIDIHEKFLAKQIKLDEALEVAMLDLSANYILGLTRQIERLTDPNEAPAVALIRTEISTTQDKAHYFTQRMRGIDPDAPKEPSAEANAKTDAKP
jgi:serine/threonine protein kinase